MKAWLLMSQQEKAQRTKDYQEYTGNYQTIHDETLVTILKPPENKLEALLELYIYQQRKGKI